MTYYQCDCGWQGSERELHTECTFNETRLEPAEYASYCPDCNASLDDLIEVAL